MLERCALIGALLVPTQFLGTPLALGDPASESGATNTPRVIHLCVYNCFTLTWKDDKYIAPHINGGTGYSVYTVEHFGPTSVAMRRIDYTPEGSPTNAATLTGSIAPGGSHIVDGVHRWDGSHDPPSKFEASWGPALELVPGSNAERSSRTKTAPSRVASAPPPAETQARPSKHVELPPGAAPAMATYPDEVRAMLQPERSLPASRANMPCPGDNVADPLEAFEIGKYAYRAAEYPRGHCWLERSAASGVGRAHVLLGVSLIMGWGVPKDATAAFELFKRIAFHTRDIWAIYFLDQCYEHRIGTADNPRMHTRVEMMLMTHPDAEALMMLIRSDEPEFRMERDRAWSNLMLSLSPPTKEIERCVRQGNGQVLCHTVHEIDQAELERRHERVDGN